MSSPTESRSGGRLFSWLLTPRARLRLPDSACSRSRRPLESGGRRVCPRPPAGHRPRQQLSGPQPPRAPLVCPHLVCSHACLRCQPPCTPSCEPWQHRWRHATPQRCLGRLLGPPSPRQPPCPPPPGVLSAPCATCRLRLWKRKAPVRARPAWGQRPWRHKGRSRSDGLDACAHADRRSPKASKDPWQPQAAQEQHPEMGWWDEELCGSRLYCEGTPGVWPGLRQQQRARCRGKVSKGAS